MIAPNCAPCDVKHLEPIATIILLCAFGLMGEIAFVAALKGYDYLLSIRERRLKALHGRKPC